MQKIITKSLTSLALAGAVALPLIASSAYGVNDTRINSRNFNSSSKAVYNNDARLLISQGKLSDNDVRCYSARRSSNKTAREWINACQKPDALIVFPKQYLDTTIEEIKKRRSSDPDAHEAYMILYSTEYADKTKPGWSASNFN